MKKLIFVLLMGFLALCLMACSNEEAVNYMDQNGFQYTITKTQTPRESDVEAWKYTSKLPSAVVKYLENDVQNRYGYKPVRSATNSYNCHSYAWHSQSENNPLWINEPNNYWLDGSYYLKTTSNNKTIPNNVYAGDIAVWFDNNGKAKHSAIVKDPKKNIVVSKWGAKGLYEHQLDWSDYDEFPTIRYYSFSGMYDTSGPYPYPRYRQYFTY